jgi:hypothetical protein
VSVRKVRSDSVLLLLASYYQWLTFGVSKRPCRDGSSCIEPSRLWTHACMRPRLLLHLLDCC